MYTASEAEALEKLNYHRIREMIRVSWSVGYNMKKPTRWDVLLKLCVYVYMNMLIITNILAIFQLEHCLHCKLSGVILWALEAVHTLHS